MVIDHNKPLKLYLNGQKIEQVMQYKYLGNIIKSVNNSNTDIFSSTYSYLCDQERKAIFGMMHKIRDIAQLSPKVMFKSFDHVIKPILVYGSDVWGHRNAGLGSIDKVMLRYCRRMHNVKATTSKIIVHGECGMLPPSVQCTISVLSFINRLHHMPANTVVKKVYEELTSLHSVGFMTWVTRVRELVTKYDMDIAKMPSNVRIRVQKCSNRPI